LASSCVEGYDGAASLRATVPYSALEAFEADNRSRMFHRVSTLDGEMVSGYAALPFWRGQLPQRPPYAALVDFYDAQFQGRAVRIAVLLQPVASARGRGMAVVQVAETLELRETLARQILVDTVWRQGMLVLLIALLVVLVVQRATRPVRRLSGELQIRREGDLTPIDSADAPRELLPLLAATNQVMDRLARLLDHQTRFVRDASHQLRTPLAVLKTQVQSALRGDLPAHEALQEINGTVDRATELANQMLALARVEQLRQQPDPGAVELATIVRAVALELLPLIADKDLEFDISTQAGAVRSHEWMLRELTRNLLHNAIRHSPPGAALSVRVAAGTNAVALTVADHGPGVSAALQARLFQPFSAGDPGSGSGLGMAICRGIAQALNGTISLENRQEHGHIRGLEATVRLALAHNQP